MGPGQIAGFVNLGIGIILSLIALILYRKKSKFLKNSLKATGIVKGLAESQGDVFTSGSMDEDSINREDENIFKNGSYAPLINFFDRSGKEYEIKGSASTPPKYKIGQQVNLLYPEHSPKKAIIDNFLEKWLLVMMMTGFGLILDLCGIMILIFVK